MLVVVPPLVAARLRIVNGVRAQIAVLYVFRGTVADVDPGAVVALVTDIAIERSVGRVSERNEVAEFEAVAEGPSKEDARNEEPLRAVALGRPHQPRREK